MARCYTCGKEGCGDNPAMNYAGKDYNVCNECVPRVRENPEGYLGERSQTERDSPGRQMPKCEACGREHSSDCKMIDYSGQKFNVCGECVVAVRENPADFLEGKKGTD